MLAIFRRMGPTLGAVLAHAFGLDQAAAQRQRATCPGCGQRRRPHMWHTRQPVGTCGARSHRPYYWCKACQRGAKRTSATDLPLVRSRSTVWALNSGVNERLRRDVIMDILHGLSPTHQECPPKRGNPTVQVFKFIDAEKTSFPIAFMCKQLGVSKAGYYAWKDRPVAQRAVADARLSTLIHQIHAGSRGTYAAPRIHAEVADEHGIRRGRKRVARLVRIAKLCGVCRRRRV